MDREPAATAVQAAGNYADEAITAVTAELPGLDPGLVRLYALLAFTKGAGTTLEDVHDAWSLWRLETRPDHPSIVPFADLHADVQELDRDYAEGIRRAASRLRGGEAAKPALPDGEYGRIEIPGYRENTGWVTAETRFGVPMAVVRDRSGRVTAEVSIGPGCRFVHLPVPGQAQPVVSPLALPAADGDDGESAGITATEPDPWTEAAPF